LKIFFILFPFVFIRSIFRNWKLIKGIKKKAQSDLEDKNIYRKKNNSSKPGSIEAEYRILKD